MSSQNKAASRAALGLACGALFICVATLWPFTFAFHPIRFQQFVSAFVFEPSTVFDLPRNIILFIPFGMGLASLLDSRGVRTIANVALTGAAGLAMTVGVESLQVFLPGRTPNLADVWSNACGAIAGVALVRASPRVLARLRAQTHRGPSLVAGVIICISAGLAAGTASALMSGVIMQPFEVAPRSPVSALTTHGVASAVHDVVVFDRAADTAAASELLEGRIPSDLRDAIVARSDDHGSARTAHPARLDESFTIALTLEPVDRGTAERASIVSLFGDDATERVAVAQDETRMVLRWQSRFDRGTASRTELEFPGVLDPTTRPRRIVISVRGVTASVRTSDGAGNGDILLAPEAVLSALLRESNYWPLTLRHAAFWRSLITFAVLVFVPPAVLLGAVLRRRGPAVATVCGILLPALCTEAAVAVYGTHAPRFVVIVTATAVTAAGFAAGRFAVRRFGLDTRTRPSGGAFPAPDAEHRQSTA